MFFFRKKSSGKSNKYKQLIIGGLLVVLIPLALASLRRPDTAQASWYNDNWAYRKAVTITVASSSSDSTSVNTLLPIDTSTLITAGKLQSSCQDIRFTNASGKLLTYYIDAGCNTTTTEVVVQIDLVPKNTTTYTLYMYYGNPSASSASNSSLSGVFNSLSQGLTGYWAMNESSWNGTTSEVRDFSGNGYHGTSASSASITSSGKYGNAGSFNGSSNRVSISSTPITSLSAWTISAWVKPASINQNGIFYYNNTGSMGFGIGGGGGGGEITGAILRGVFDGVAWLVTTYSFTDTTTWHHVVMQRSGGTTTFYVDGTALSGTTNSTSTPTGSSTGASIGRDGASRYFNGTIDDVRTYNRALSSTEITNLYNNPGTIATSGIASSGTTPTFATEETTPGPAAYWKLDDGTGTTAQDSTQQNKDGTISGATWKTEDACIAGKCLLLDGSDDSISVASPNLPTANFTYQAWVKLNTNTDETVFMAADGSGGNEFQMYINSSNKLIVTTNNAAVLTTTNSINANSWTHLAVTRSGSTITAYINGVPDSTTGSDAVALSFSTCALLIGVDADASCTGSLANYMHGFIDEAKIYPYARTTAQVLTDYNSRGSVKGSSINFSQNQQNASSTLSNGLVGYWKMDESSGNATDSSGNNTTLTNNGTTTYVAGKFGNSGNFSVASNQYMSATNPSAIHTSSNGFTFSSWIRLNSIPGVNSTIVGKGGGGETNEEFYCIWQQSNSLISCNLGNSSGGFGTSVSASNFGTISANTWYFVALTFNGTNSVTLSVNGISNTATVSSPPVAQSSNFYIGSYNNAPNITWEGKIDEIRFYNRGLSSAETAVLYTFTPGPVAYWDFDENTGSSVTDSSGNANTGTLNSGPTWATGKYGSAVNFDGSNDDISTTNGDIISTQGSIGAWVNIAAYGLSGEAYIHVIASEETSGGNSDFKLQIGDATDGGKDNLVLDSRLDGTDTVSISTTNLALNTWYYVSGTWDGTTQKLYVNGILEDSDSASTAIPAADTGAYKIGELGSDTIRNWQGKIDDVKIYNYARSAKQIVEDMNAGHPAVGSPVGSAVGHWKFDEGFSTTANNSGNQGSTLNGSMSGFASPATATSGWTNSGKFGKALIFDGTNDYVSTTAFQGPQNGFTTSAWIYPTSIASKTSLVISQYQAAGAYMQFYIDTTGILGGRIHQVRDTTFIGRTTPAGSLVNNNWYHVSFTWDGTTTSAGIKIYVNGLRVDSANDQAGTFTAPYASTVILNIGGQNNATTNVFTGTIDEPKIYNYALTADEVKIDYNQGQAQVLGTLSDKSTYQPQAANQEYCVPGDTTTSCAAPVGKWDLDEGRGSSTNDTSGNGYNGTLNNSPTWKNGKINRALSFDGSSNVYVSVTDNSSLSFTGNNMSIAGWIKPNITTGTRYFAGKYKCGVTYSEYAIGISSGKAVMQVGNNSGTIATATGATTLSANTWYHLEGTYDGSTVKIYVNGILDGTQSSSLSMFDGTANFGIGALEGDGSVPCSSKNTSFESNAIVDQVRLFNYARSGAQAAWDYNRGAPVGHWKFDQCQGTVANDSSGNANTGTITPGSGGQTAVGTCTGSAGTMWADGATGKYNSSLDFDGTDDDVEIAHNSTLVTSGTTITLSAWVKFASSFEADDRIMSKTGSNTGYTLRIDDNSANNLEVYIGDGSSYHFCAKAHGMSTGNWYHLVATYNGSAFNLYVNGKSIGSCTDSFTPSWGTTTLKFNSNDGSPFPWQGQMDDVRIYNYALTATQINALYNGNAAVRFGPVTGTP